MATSRGCAARQALLNGVCSVCKRHVRAVRARNPGDTGVCEQCAGCTGANCGNCQTKFYPQVDQYSVFRLLDYCGDLAEEECAGQALSPCCAPGKPLGM